jgi:hypothetical protein
MLSPMAIRNKDQMARFLAQRFPELVRYVPPERKPWMSEDERMAIFDAVSFALGLFQCEKATLNVPSRDYGTKAAPP